MIDVQTTNGHVRGGLRFTGKRRCPICDGTDRDPRGAERRCFGYLSTDRAFAHCTRGDRAGGIAMNAKSETFAHKMAGECICGETHGAAETHADGIEATYDYRDEAGELLFQVVRKPGKRFVQRRPSDAGGWTYKTAGVRRVLYRLPAVIDTKSVVFVVEGEKDADTLQSINLPATCNPMGAGKWHHVADHARQVLTGRDVVIIPDADEKGRAHATDVARSLHGYARSIRLVELPAKDATEWIDSHGGDHAQLVALVRATPPYAGHGTTEPTPTRTPTKSEGVSEFPTVVTLSNVEPTAISWLWKSYIAFGVLSLIDGDPGLGKSTITHDLAARVTTGAPMPFETSRRPPADVILLTAEDHLSATVRPRCDAADADVSRIHVITAMPTKEDPTAPPMLTAADIARLELVIVRYDVKFVVVDPLMAFLDAKVDSAKDQDVRRVLRLLAAVAERTGVAIVVVRHLRKSGGPAIYRGGGSIGIIGAARTALLVARDPDDAEGRILAVEKSNLCAFPPALRFGLLDAGGVGRVEWLGVADGVTADDLAAVPDNVRTQDEDPIDSAVAALQEVLSGGSRPSKQVETDVKAMTGCSARTLDRARQQLGLTARKVGKVWHLALKDANTASTRSGGVLDDAESRKPVTPSRKSRQKEERHAKGRHQETNAVASLDLGSPEEGAL